MWNIGFIQYPYLGSLLIDTPQNSEVYNALIKKYGNPYSKEKENNKALWIMDYEKTCKLNEKTKSFLKIFKIQIIKKILRSR